MTLAHIDKLHRSAVKLDGRPLPGIRMTEAEFESWLDEDIRAEWINGEVIMMSPANTDHVELNGWLWQVVGGFTEYHESGRVFGIETQVRLPKQKRRRNPDLLFVAHARSRLIRKTYIDGPPDLIIEIVSPDSESRDCATNLSTTRPPVFVNTGLSILRRGASKPTLFRHALNTIAASTKHATKFPLASSAVFSFVLRGSGNLRFPKLPPCLKNSACDNASIPSANSKNHPATSLPHIP